VPPFTLENELSEQKHTPEERAVIALSHAAEFCNLIAQARRYKAHGCWEGSAFRSHPCGLVADTIKLTNHWHVDNLGTVYITDGAGWDTRSICRDSCAHGDPHPHAIGGSELQVWRCGRWADAAYEQALRPRLLEILTAAARHVEAAQAEERRQQEESSAARERQFQNSMQAAIAKATGVPQP
jgi:hypothetical protein